MNETQPLLNVVRAGLSRHLRASGFREALDTLARSQQRPDETYQQACLRVLTQSPEGQLLYRGYSEAARREASRVRAPVRADNGLVH